MTPAPKMPRDLKSQADALADALRQFMDELSAGDGKFPGYGVCEQAWDEADAALSAYEGEENDA